MGYSPCNNITNLKTRRENPQIQTPSISSNSKVTNHEVEDNNKDDDNVVDYDTYKEMRSKSLLTKVVWEFGLGCFAGAKQRNITSDMETNNDQTNIEHNNKAWLLAESGGDLANGELHTVHSSFRFNLCSHVEVDPTCSNNLSSTVLMVNLDTNDSDSHSKEVLLRRIETLEKSISPLAADSLIKFSFDEIVSSTSNFSQGKVLGRGALSYVFRGRVGLLRTRVAIKRLDKEDKESPKAFCRELMIASSLQHPNIVPLLGFCIDPEQGLFLVYKYVSSGTLEHHLHGKKKGVKGFASLSWSVRYKVAVGIAEAIAYLHNETGKCIVHRDIKPSNVLLSSKKRPKLCDFGLATWTSAPSVPFLCKTVKGTFGYLAPEYFQHGKVSDKTDVYAFGVVLLELITGRKPIESSRPLGEENLVQWAKPLLDKGDAGVNTLLDHRSKVTPNTSKLIPLMIRAASACLKSDDSSRPSINDVITLLRGESCLVKNEAGFGRNGCASQRLQRSNSEMKNHFALAMLGASELDDDDFLYDR